MKPDLSVVMCTYNENGRIQRAVEEFLESMHGRDETVEILCIDNGSTDGTREWLAGYSHPNVRVILNETNLGKGGSIKKGFAMATGKWVCIHDPDLEYRALDVWRCLDRARETRAQLVLGSRVLGGQTRFLYRMNYWGVLGLTGVIKLLFGATITDAATAMKLLDGDIARKLRLECNGFDLDFEIITRIARLGGTVAEVHVEYYPRSVAEGKKVRAFHDGIAALRAIVRDRLRRASDFVQAQPPAEVVPIHTVATEPGDEAVDVAAAGGRGSN